MRPLDGVDAVTGTRFERFSFGLALQALPAGIDLVFSVQKTADDADACTDDDEGRPKEDELSARHGADTPDTGRDGRTAHRTRQPLAETALIFAFGLSLEIGLRLRRRIIGGGEVGQDRWEIAERLCVQHGVRSFIVFFAVEPTVRERIGQNLIDHVTVGIGGPQRSGARVPWIAAKTGPDVAGWRFCHDYRFFHA